MNTLQAFLQIFYMNSR